MENEESRGLDFIPKVPLEPHARVWWMSPPRQPEGSMQLGL